MNKETLEHISSLMDGELSRETGLFLTKRLSADKELTGAWERYHLIRDCIRQPGTRAPVVDLSLRMKNALADEVNEPAQNWTVNRWLKPVSGIAIAASVALMAIVAIGPGPSPQTGDTASSPTVQPFSSPNVLPSSLITQAASYSPQAQGRDARLSAYLLRHNQASNSITTLGFVSFVPMVASATYEDSLLEDLLLEDPQLDEASGEAVESTTADSP